MIKLINGNCLDELRKLKYNTIDSLVTDPPAGIGFMGKEWDNDKGGRDSWIAWMTEVMAEALRVLKPGAHGFVWALPRTSGWTSMALENAGFEVRDVVTHLFGSGFPKSHNISKAIDKKFGAERERIADNPNARDSHGSNPISMQSSSNSKQEGITKPATDLAKQWDGYGTSLKPASEHWILVRKPLSEKNIVDNVLKWGVGGINIDASRVHVDKGDDNNGDKIPLHTKYEILDKINNCLVSFGYELFSKFRQSNDVSYVQTWKIKQDFQSDCQACLHLYDALLHLFLKDGLDTFPLLRVVHDDIYHLCKEQTCSPCNQGNSHLSNLDVLSLLKPYLINTTPTLTSQGRFPANLILDEEAGRLLDEQSGVLKNGGQNYKGGDSNSIFGNSRVVEPTTYAGDKGGASRFFYCAKASKSERGENNTHPTIKPQKLMQYLIKMITPPNGIVLDPFMGSGSTGVACKTLGFNFIGIEKDLEYFQIASKRINNG